MKQNNRLDGHDEDNTHEEASDSQGQNPVEGFVSMPEMRLLNLYGEVDEKKASDIVYSMHVYSRIKRIIPLDDNMPPKTFDQVIDPMELLISTPGGSASDMFAIYDTMRMLREEMEIHTIGMGKVMSAGVLLLAAGTKGKRKIGKNCRVMIHSAIGGMMGSSHDIRNEIQELLLSENRYVKGLAKETKMTVKQIREFLSEKKNIYLSAEQAVKYGIADIIV